LEGTGWVVGSVVGLLVVPYREVEMYPHIRARTAEAWRKRARTRRIIPLSERMPKILTVALACSFAADLLVCVCQHGATWEALGATRLGGTTYTLGLATARGAERMLWMAGIEPSAVGLGRVSIRLGPPDVQLIAHDTGKLRAVRLCIYRKGVCRYAL